MTIITVMPHDPLIVRDGRPFGVEKFGFGNKARSLDWPYPSVLAGGLRTLLGKMLAPEKERPFDNVNLLSRLKAISVAGPLPMVGRELFLPAPHDVVAYEQGQVRKSMTLRPRSLHEGEGCDLPHPGLWPVEVTKDIKPAKMPAFWSRTCIISWLAQDDPADFEMTESLGAFPKEERVHVQINPETHTSAEGLLFSTQGLAITAFDIPENKERRRNKQIGVRLAVLVASDDPQVQSMISELKALHPLGGERRLAEFESQEDGSSWQCPTVVSQALEGASAVRMVLAAPAIFSGGWLPGWLDSKTLEGTPPNCNTRLRLRGACVERWRPISGWSLEKGQFGPKPLRRLVPVGSVYFFEVLSGSPKELANLWLKPVSDNEQDRTDGFGLSLWGVWERKTLK